MHPSRSKRGISVQVERERGSSVVDWIVLAVWGKKY